MTNAKEDPYQTIGETPSGGTDELEPGMVLNAKYKLIKSIGQGGMGVVWAADDLTVKDRKIVLKFVPRELKNFDDAVDQVMTTFRKVHPLQHQHLCPVYDIVDDRTFGYYLVMKCLEGETLNQYVARTLKPNDQNGHQSPNPMSLDEVVRILHPVAEALDYAHAQGIIHRDIKPQNIFLVLDEAKKIKDVQVIDFGIADEIMESLTRVSQYTFNRSGTRPYMAPEQWQGEKQTVATDQYSLGVVAYQLLAGHLPFQQSDVAALGFAVLNVPPKPIQEQSEHVNAVILKALAKDGNDRFGSCGEFLNALKRGTNKKSVPDLVESDNSTVIPDHAVTQRRWLSCGLLFAGIVFVLLVSIFLFFKPSTPKFSAPMLSHPVIEGGPVVAGKQAGDRMILTLHGVQYPFRWCPPGTFMMGSPFSEPERDDDETQHEVTLTRGFWMLETQVTQVMWETVMGKNPGHFRGSQLPVEQVSWADCQELIKRLNDLLTESLNGHQLSLPTEAQWEYACRAGTTTPFHFGSSLNGDQANCDGNFPYLTTKGKSLKKTMQVGSYLANAWGLHDMHGNVWEWCSDWYGPYPGGRATDPVGSSTGSDRVLRGGSWSHYARKCRSAFRDFDTPLSRKNDVGFRLTLVREK